MSDKPLTFTPPQLPSIEDAMAARRRVMGKLRSFDQMRWDGTAYGPHARQTMYLQELNDLCPRDGWPTILMIHGGGWVSGSNKDFEHLTPLFARKGIQAAAMDYRLAPDHRWPAQLEDVLLAIDFLQAQQCDLKRIALWGFSAGGQLALLAALKRPNAIKCVVSIGAPTHLGLTEKSLWGPCFEKEQLDEASPALYGSSNLPPTLILHGESDPVVSSEQAKLFHAAFPNESTLKIVKNGDHGLRRPVLAGMVSKRSAIKWVEKKMDMPKRGSKWKRRRKKKSVT